ncbi:MAG TPA: hypothetical protein VLG40_02975 [Candidatus Saccharimonas sp.]|nr:hypothetical protein [Candidatus Saccharimonas sp.]
MPTTRFHIYKGSSVNRMYYTGSGWTFNLEGAQLYDTRKEAEDDIPWTGESTARVGETIG